MLRRSLPLLGLLALLLSAPGVASARPQLEEGNSGADVLHLNQKLRDLHYLAGKQGSHYGTNTVDAIIAFQKWERLNRDGVAGPRVRRRLASAHTPTPLLRRGGKRVEISISRQLLLEVRAGKVRRALPVSTGRPGYDTSQGQYQVYAQYVRSWSNPYSVWLPWASYFNGGIAMHGYGDVPTYPASHGCVRVPLKFAHSLYRFARVGTEVDVVQ